MFTLITIFFMFMLFINFYLLSLYTQILFYYFYDYQLRQYGFFFVFDYRYFINNVFLFYSILKIKLISKIAMKLFSIESIYVTNLVFFYYSISLIHLN